MLRGWYYWVLNTRQQICGGFVDVENEYIEEDGILEDVVEEMVNELGDDDDGSDVDEED